MNNLEYKKYSLENIKKWITDALTTGDVSAQEIYDTIRKTVEEEYYYFKHYTGRCYELLALLNGNGIGHLSCDKDDKSPECQKAWNDFWEENYYPEENQKHNEEVKDDGMRPWGHSDLEYLIANPTLTEDRISNFPGEQYTEEELDAMCEKAKLDDQKRHFIRETSETVTSGASVSPKKDKVVRWQLPVEVDGLTGDCYVSFPDDLLEAANLKEGDTIRWSDCGDGSFRITKLTKPIKMEDC